MRRSRLRSTVNSRFAVFSAVFQIFFRYFFKYFFRFKSNTSAKSFTFYTYFRKIYVSIQTVTRKKCLRFFSLDFTLPLCIEAGSKVSREGPLARSQVSALPCGAAPGANKRRV